MSAATDINPSYALTTCICAYRPQDMTYVVLAHLVKPVHIAQKLNATAYNAAVYDALAEHGRAIAQLGVKVNGWAIDAEGQQFDPVCLFAKESVRLCGIPACACVGRSSTKFNGLVKSRLAQERNRTVLCGDEAEHIRSGSGKRHLFGDSDFYKEAVLRGFLSEVGSPGGCSLYRGDDREHAEFAIQLCNE